jgi:hypothetical protein
MLVHVATTPPPLRSGGFFSTAATQRELSDASNGILQRPPLSSLGHLLCSDTQSILELVAKMQSTTV